MKNANQDCEGPWEMASEIRKEKLKQARDDGCGFYDLRCFLGWTLETVFSKNII